MHAFGVGENASRRLIEGLAEAGRGRAEFIATGERMQSKVIYKIYILFKTIGLKRNYIKSQFLRRKKSI